MTGNPQFKFTLSHAIKGTLEISEPINWVNAVLKLERHEDFHSLIEYFDGAFFNVNYNDSEPKCGHIVTQRFYSVDMLREAKKDGKIILTPWLKRHD